MRRVAVLGAALLLALCGCGDDRAAREAAETRRRLEAEQEARRCAEEGRRRAEEDSRATERRCDDLRREKREANHIAGIERKRAESRIHTLWVLSTGVLLALSILILLLARERSLRRVAHAALRWVLGRGGRHGS